MITDNRKEKSIETPAEKTRNDNVVAKTIDTYKREIICILAGILLFVLLTFFDPSGGTEIKKLRRKGYGDDTKKELYVEGISEEDIKISIPLSGRKFKEDEIDDAFEKCAEELETVILGEDNADSQEIYSDLNLPDKSETYGFRLNWMTDNYELLSSNGEVKNEELESPEDVELTVLMKDIYSGHNAVYSYMLRIMPKKYTETETTVHRLIKKISETDREHPEEEIIDLPSEIDGHSVKYRTQEKSSYIFIPVLGVLAAVLLRLKDKQDRKTDDEKRYKSMQLDYPEIVSKLMVFIGAGMSIRTAWDCICYDYESAGGDARPAYDEMCRANNRLKTGVPEGKVYRDFGRECKSKQYMKLASLLEQNRKSGVANIKSLLSLEMVEAWEERKNLAARMGEEASTKLLVPLIMMLGIVMVMIMVPAMMTF